MKIQFSFWDNLVQFRRRSSEELVSVEEQGYKISYKVKQEKHRGAPWSPTRRHSFITVSGWLKANDKELPPDPKVNSQISEEREF